MARPRGRPKRGIGPALGRKHGQGFRKAHGQAKICKVAIFQFSHLFPCGQAKTASEMVSTQMRAETSKAQAALPAAVADRAHCMKHPIQVKERHTMHSCQGHFECKNQPPLGTQPHGVDVLAAPVPQQHSDVQLSRDVAAAQIIRSQLAAKTIQRLQERFVSHTVKELQSCLKLKPSAFFFL